VVVANCLRVRHTTDKSASSSLPLLSELERKREGKNKRVLKEQGGSGSDEDENERIGESDAVQLQHTAECNSRPI
jgi:hypothetical protein